MLSILMWADTSKNCMLFWTHLSQITHFTQSFFPGYIFISTCFDWKVMAEMYRQRLLSKHNYSAFYNCIMSCCPVTVYIPVLSLHGIRFHKSTHVMHVISYLHNQVMRTRSWGTRLWEPGHDYWRIRLWGTRS